MTTSERPSPGILETLESALVRAIKGAIWFPVMYLPRQIQKAFPVAVRLLRVLALFAVWVALVCWPLAFIDDIEDPLVGFGVVGWTVMGLVGSVAGVLRHRKSAARSAAAAKPADLAEAFV